MAGTLKIPDDDPKQDFTATVVHIAEYDRGTLKMIQDWPVEEYEQKTVAIRARQIVDELLKAMFPDPARQGTRPLTEQDLTTIRQAVKMRLPPIPDVASSTVA